MQFFRERQTPKKREPSLLVLQTESVLIKFEPSSPLPIPLETTRVCDCVSVVLYSQARGVAYLAHIFLRELGQINFEKYRHSISEIITEYQLNDANTFAAIIGGQNQLMDELVQIEDSSVCGVQTVVKFLQPQFPNMHLNIGGEAIRERAVELTHTAVRSVTLDFMSDKTITVAFSECGIPPIPSTESLLKKIVKMTYYRWGLENFSFSEDECSTFNDYLREDHHHPELLEWIDSSLETRFPAIGLLMVNRKQTTNATVLTLASSFNLETVPQAKISSAAYNCAVFKATLFYYLLNLVGYDVLLTLSSREMNNFRLRKVQALLTEGKVTIDQVRKMEEFADKILSNSKYYRVYFNSLEAHEVLWIKETDEYGKKFLDIIDKLLSADKVTKEQLSTMKFEDVISLYQRCMQEPEFQILSGFPSIPDENVSLVSTPKTYGGCVTM